MSPETSHHIAIKSRRTAQSTSLLIARNTINNMPREAFLDNNSFPQDQLLQAGV